MGLLKSVVCNSCWLLCCALPPAQGQQGTFAIWIDETRLGRMGEL
jgi:hypothetical protein